MKLIFEAKCKKCNSLNVWYLKSIDLDVIDNGYMGYEIEVYEICQVCKKGSTYEIN